MPPKTAKIAKTAKTAKTAKITTRGSPTKGTTGHAVDPKTYAQFCPLASAMDVIGDRWTLLIVRELLFLGPRRFTDLAAGLPGIAPNLLTTRLRGLESAGLVTRDKLPPPAASSVYQLTERGRGLRDVVIALMRWGAGQMKPLADADIVRPELALMALEAAFDPAGSRGEDVVFELVVDDLVVSLHVHDGVLEIARTSALDPRLRMTMSLHVLARLVAGQDQPLDAIGRGDVELEGDLAAADLFLRLFPREIAAP